MKKGLLICLLLGTYGIMNAQISEVPFQGFVNDMQLTNTVVEGKTPVPQKVASPTATTATYMIPEGYLFSGMATDYNSLNGMVIMGSGSTATKWTSIASGTQSISWTFKGDNYPQQTVNEANPIVTLPAGLYNMPLLSAGGTNYQLGIAGGKNVMKLGGDNTWQVSTVLGQPRYKTFGLGNYDLSKGWSFQSDMKDNEEFDYIGEKLSIGKYKGIGNVFEKPNGTMSFDKIYVHCIDLKLNDNKTVTVNIYEEANNHAGKLIATATTKEVDIIKAGVQDTVTFYTVPFSFSSSITPNTAFFVEFTGYKSTAVCLQMQNSLKNYAYAVFEQDRIPLSEIYEDAVKEPYKGSFLIDLNGTFPRNNGIASVSQQEQVSVQYLGDQRILIYPSEATAVLIYTTAGRQIAEYPLDKTGTYILPTAQWNKGVYILKFKGINSVIKIVQN
ncbi:hypothetical protein AGMMS50262_16140 [Bacteroidia bacterium]|nr:hypothetical protein AGMMS50262_16140 [Bacteroidia bacterium]